MIKWSKEASSCSQPLEYLTEPITFSLCDKAKKLYAALIQSIPQDGKEEMS
jgi:hypothetical protein